MKVAVLTSSRADYGIYSPLLEKLNNDSFFDLNIIAFGTHLSAKYGMTINEIIKDNYNIIEKVYTLPVNDTPEAISSAIGKTIMDFAEIWKKHKFDIIIALGDRYEMFAAVTASIPYNIKIAHLHGGETTLGAIDNVFRHSITLMSHIHFTAAEIYKNRVAEIIGSNKNVFNVGALSIDNIKSLNLLSVDDFYKKFNIDLSKPSILITFHPETIDHHKNNEYITELIDALKLIKQFQLIITMPNADTMGLLIRDKLNDFISYTDNAIGVESLGSLGYLTCIKHCSLMLGNSSSGFIEAAGFNKAVVNLGKRQSGRIVTPNIFNSEIKKNDILNTIDIALKYDDKKGINIYGDGSAAEKIIEILKNYAE